MIDTTRTLMVLALATLHLSQSCSPGCPVERVNGLRCGFRTGIECLPWPFSIANLTASPPQEDLVALAERTRHRAERSCNGARFSVGQNGAWCLTARKLANGTVLNGTGDLPQGHVPPNPGFVDGLDRLLRVQTPGGTAFQSVADFGAGVGQLGVALLERSRRHRYRGYDGSGNVEQWTKGFVHFADITTPLSVPKAHWVVTTEAGEHIPNGFEGTFIRNLHAHNCLGIVLTWAHLNQGGHGHINNHDPLYLRRLFEQLDYVVDERRTMQMMHSSFAVRGDANATECLGQMYGTPSRKFYPCSTLQVLRRRRPAAGCGDDASAVPLPLNPLLVSR